MSAAVLSVSPNAQAEITKVRSAKNPTRLMEIVNSVVTMQFENDALFQILSAVAKSPACDDTTAKLVANRSKDLVNPEQKKVQLFAVAKTGWFYPVGYWGM